jgi:RNAse (barnase) inhibitor barstar
VAETESRILKQVINQDKLIISRIPKSVKMEFQEYAKQEYCDDYGMAFKAVWDYFKEDVRYQDLLVRVVNLENSKKEIKTISGEVIRK